MQQSMKYVIFWPYWNVPSAILRHEIIPKLRRDRSYLEKEGFDHLAADEKHEGEQGNLAKAIPVLIVYTTASVTEDGTVHFFKDIYGYDESLHKPCCQAYASRN